MKRLFIFILATIPVLLLLLPTPTLADISTWPRNPPTFGQTQPPPDLIRDILPLIILYLGLTIALELPVYLIAGMKKIREILSVVAVNIISYLSLYAGLALLDSLDHGFSYMDSLETIAVFLSLEGIVVIIETVLLKLLIKGTTWKRLVPLVLYANIVTAGLGFVFGILNL